MMAEDRSIDNRRVRVVFQPHPFRTLFCAMRVDTELATTSSSVHAGVPALHSERGIFDRGFDSFSRPFPAPHRIAGLMRVRYNTLLHYHLASPRAPYAATPILATSASASLAACPPSRRRRQLAADDPLFWWAGCDA